MKDQKAGSLFSESNALRRMKTKLEALPTPNGVGEKKRRRRRKGLEQTSTLTDEETELSVVARKSALGEENAAFTNDAEESKFMEQPSVRKKIVKTVDTLEETGKYDESLQSEVSKEKHNPEMRRMRDKEGGEYSREEDWDIEESKIKQAQPRIRKSKQSAQRPMQELEEMDIIQQDRSDSVEMLFKRERKGTKASGKKSKTSDLEVIKKKSKKPVQAESESSIKAAEQDEQSKKASQQSKKRSSKLREKLEGQEEKADPDRIFGVLVHGTDALEADLLLSHPSVKVHLVDLTTGAYITKSRKDQPSTYYYERKDISFVQPLLTQPFDFREKRSLIPKWEELLVFNEDLNRFLEDNKIIIFFEIVDFVNCDLATKRYKKLGSEGGWHKVAWAFLKVVGANKEANVGERLRLKLFKPPQHFRTHQGIVSVYDWWRKKKQRAYPSTLYVTLKGIKIPEVVEPTLRSMAPIQAESGNSIESKTVLIEKVSAQPKVLHDLKEGSRWSRLHGQSCRVPNKLLQSLRTAGQGCNVLKFSPSGMLLAAGCPTSNPSQHLIIIYEIPSGRKLLDLQSHEDIIYELDWSCDGLLSSASADRTVCLWSFTSESSAWVPPHQILAHPAYTYCCRFHPNDPNLLVSGCYDQIIRFWRRDGGGTEDFKLAQELDGHGSWVNALCFSIDGQRIFSGDGAGVLRVWYRAGDMWAYQREIRLDNLVGQAVSSLSMHPGGRRLLVRAREGFLGTLSSDEPNDARSHQLQPQQLHPLQEYAGALNVRLHLCASLSPCGGLVLGPSEEGSLLVWATDSGLLMPPLKPEKCTGAASCADFHPWEHMVAVGYFAEDSFVHIFGYSKDEVHERMNMTIIPVAQHLSEEEKSMHTEKNISVQVTPSEEMEMEKLATIVKKLSTALTFTQMCSAKDRTSAASNAEAFLSEKGEGAASSLEPHDSQLFLPPIVPRTKGRRGHHVTWGEQERRGKEEEKETAEKKEEVEENPETLMSVVRTASGGITFVAEDKGQIGLAPSRARLQRRAAKRTDWDRFMS